MSEKIGKLERPGAPPELEGRITSRVYGPVSFSYASLNDKPQIEGNTLIGDKSFEELGLIEATNQDILDMFKK